MSAQPASKVERFRRLWADEEFRVPKFADDLPRSPKVALDRCDALLAFALETNPALAEGDGDLEAHYRVHDFLMKQSGGRGRR